MYQMSWYLMHQREVLVGQPLRPSHCPMSNACGGRGASCASRTREVNQNKQVDAQYEQTNVETIEGIMMNILISLNIIEYLFRANGHYIFVSVSGLINHDDDTYMWTTKSSTTFNNHQSVSISVLGDFSIPPHVFSQHKLASRKPCIIIRPSIVGVRSNRSVAQ